MPSLVTDQAKVKRAAVSTLLGSVADALRAICVPSGEVGLPSYPNRFGRPRMTGIGATFVTVTGTLVVPVPQSLSVAVSVMT